MGSDHLIFYKMHGIGNDYVYVNGFVEHVANPVQTAIKVSDRHFGIGGDGLILILPSDRADVRMRMFNADGSESEMCGNGVRCVAKFAFERGLASANPMKIETGFEAKVVVGAIPCWPPCDDPGCLKVDGAFQTLVPGVFAIGDVICTRIRQAVVAAADGVIAAGAVEKYLRGSEKIQSDWGQK